MLPPLLKFQNALAYFFASAAATFLPLLMARFLWPDGLDPGALFLFWPASGVNLVLALLLGRRFVPLILLHIPVGVLVLGEPALYWSVGMVANMLETLFGAWLLGRFGKLEGGVKALETTRMVIGLAVVSLVAPAITGATTTAVAMLSGLYPPGTSVNVFIGIAFGNACGIVVLAPAILAFCGNGWRLGGRHVEAAILVLATLLAGWFGFLGLFSEVPNTIFLIFVITAFAASRFGNREVAFLNLLTLVMIYVTMIIHADLLPTGKSSRALWLLPSFLWILSISSLLMAAQISERNKAIQRLLAQQNTLLELRLREERARLSSLRHQVNPHFLFNALNSIYAALPEHGAGHSTPRRMLTRLAGYLRSTLSAPSADLHPLSDELENVRHYLSIEKDRFGDALQVEMDLPPECDAFPVPVFVLQLLVENAVRHGLTEQRGDFRLVISVRPADNAGILLEVANTGVWKESNGAGEGLKNIRRRLALLYGKDRASINDSCENGWVRMRVHLPAGETIMDTTAL